MCSTILFGTLFRYICVGNHDHFLWRAENQVNIGDPRWYMPAMTYPFKISSKVCSLMKGNLKIQEYFNVAYFIYRTQL